MPENDMENNKELVAYEQAIKAYQFHVQRYHTWVNYYAIFTGALFVAFYNVMPDFKGGYAVCGCCMASLPLEWWFSLLIALVGWFASICWQASIEGHYRWMLSWTRVLKLRERKYFEGEVGDNKAIFVYDGVLYGKVLSGKTDESNLMLPGFVSTQKVTQIFVRVVMLAWIAVVFLLGLAAGLGICCALIFPLLLSIFSLLSYSYIFSKMGKWYSSTHLKIRSDDE